MPGSLRRLLDPGDWLAVKPQLDPTATALQINHAPSPAEYRLRIWAGLIVLAVFSAVVYFFRDDGFTIFIFCGLGLFGFLNLVYGVIQSRFSMSVSITGSEVSLDSKTLFGRKLWREWLKSYRGVLLRESQLPDNDIDTIRSTRRFHIVELAHDDAAKTIALYVKEGGPAPRDIQEAFARRFNLPALAPDTCGETPRPATDPGPPCPGVLVRPQGEATCLTIESTPAGKGMVWLFWLLLPVVFGGLVYQLDPMVGYLAAGMAVLFVFVMLGIGKLTSGKKGSDRRAILIDRERVSIDQPNIREDPTLKFMMQTVSRIARHPLPPAHAPVTSLPRGAIERVRVDQYTSHDSDGPAFHPRLVIEGDGGTLEYIGAQFDRKKLEWIRDYLRYRLASRS